MLTLDKPALLSRFEAGHRTAAEIKRLLSERKIEQYHPYPKQAEFHRAGGEEEVIERLLMAASQVGKTWAAAFETAYHLTGKYPEWWQGARFELSIVGWAASNSGQATRDTVQRLLLGRPGEWGTGTIPKADIVKISRASGSVPDLVETILVRHVTGSVSTLTVKSYDQGRLRWQGESLNIVWFDEEPPPDVYSEGKTRVVASHGITYLTFTPLLGVSEVVRRFLVEKAEGTHITHMGIEDALHFTDTERALIIRSYPEHEREARAHGIPVLGSGRVFPVTEESIQETAIALPVPWPRLCGLDIGYDHPTAAAWLAWDREADIVHVYDCYRVRLGTPVIHAAAIRARGAWIPVAWPHDALQHDKGGSCEQIAQQYRVLGVTMLADKATHPPRPNEKEGTGDYGVEAGLMDMLDRMQTGRLKVAKHLADWWEEFRLYHRKDGKLVKVGEDLMSATRVGLMMLRFAKVNVKAKEKPLPTYRPTDRTMGVLGSLLLAVGVTFFMAMGAVC